MPLSVIVCLIEGGSPVDGCSGGERVGMARLLVVGGEELCVLGHLRADVVLEPFITIFEHITFIQ